MANKNRITGPMDPIPVCDIQGVPIAIIADLPEGGYIQVVSGKNPIVPATPSVQAADGAMLAIIPAEVAAHIRPNLKQAYKQADKLKAGVGLGIGPGLVGGPEQPQ